VFTAHFKALTGNLVTSKGPIHSILIDKVKRRGHKTVKEHCRSEGGCASQRLLIVMTLPPQMDDNGGGDDNTISDCDDRNADNMAAAETIAAMTAIHQRRDRSVSDDNDLSSMAEVVQQWQRAFQR
jgi:hypothetical protein